MRDNCLELLGANASIAELPADDLVAEVHDWLDEYWVRSSTSPTGRSLVAKAGATTPHFTPEEGGRGVSRRTAARRLRG